MEVIGGRSAREVKVLYARWRETREDVKGAGGIEPATRTGGGTPPDLLRRLGEVRVLAVVRAGEDLLLADQEDVVSVSSQRRNHFEAKTPLEGKSIPPGTSGHALLSRSDGQEPRPIRLL